MEKVNPPEVMDWFDAVMGVVVVVGGTFLAMFAAGVLQYW
jgi:hypothetical protein